MAEKPHDRITVVARAARELPAALSVTRAAHAYPRPRACYAARPCMPVRQCPWWVVARLVRSLEDPGMCVLAVHVYTHTHTHSVRYAFIISVRLLISLVELRLVRYIARWFERISDDR